MANRLKEVRTESGLSIRELAKRSGITIQTIYNIERGSVHDDRIIFSTVKKLSVALGRKIEELFF